MKHDLRTTPHYLRVAQALALAGSAALISACGVSPPTGAPCNRNGQPCTVGEPTPTDDTCCRCSATRTDAGADGEDGAPGDGSPGTWGSVCIGPLAPPSLAA